MATPQKFAWAVDQAQQIRDADDTSVAQIQGRPVVLLATTGARSGQTRHVPLMRVEHDGSYAAVASAGGQERDPQWAHNLRAHRDVDVLDGTEHRMTRVRELPPGDERDAWWERCVAAFPPYAEYQERAERLIPVFVLEPAG